MHHLRKVGPGEARGGAGALGVRPHPGLRTWPPPLVCGLLVGPRLLLCWCFDRRLKFGWVFAYVLLECAFSVVHFSVFSHDALQNMYVPKLVENFS